MFLIAGLGNPESKYLKTYHNIGFMVLEVISQKINKPIKKKLCKGLTLQTVINGNEVIFVFPQTYMNLSGECIKSVMKKFDIPPENLLVIYDDFDLSKGELRFKTKGTGGTHNGMRSIIKCIGTTEFNRLRVGIDKPQFGDVSDYVLSEIKKGEQEIMFKAIMQAADIALDFVSGKMPEDIMLSTNTKHNP